MGIDYDKELRRLQAALDKIPPQGAINLARRRVIMQQICELMEQMERM